MALTKCTECGKEISKKAESCPECGHPTKFGKKQAKKAKINKKGNTQGCGCLLIILAFVLALTVIGAPFAWIIGIIGLIILIIGLLPVF